MIQAKIHRSVEKVWTLLNSTGRGLVVCILVNTILSFSLFNKVRAYPATTYYLDSKSGNDQNSGMTTKSPWKTLSRLSRTPLHPGDSVCFRRGSAFTGPWTISSSGTKENPIVITDYGSKKDSAPRFTNTIFSEGNYGNCIRISGSYVVVEHLYFSGTPAYHPISYTGEGWVVWEMGAIHIERGAKHCTLRNNEITDCVAGIRSNGEYAIIEYNYIHDCNRVLKQWDWGPLGIWLGADHQEVRYNKIINYSTVDPRIRWGPHSYGSGADGGAIEIDDARYGKSDISIHHNYTRDCQGFLEVTWTDVKKRPSYRNFRIHHNVSDDYQQFIALWWGRDCRIENNTIIRRKVNANEWGVFNITQPDAHNLVRNNIIVTENGVVIFNLGRKGDAHPKTIISNNLYFAAEGKLNVGKEGPGDGAIFENPLFRNYEHARRASDFSIKAKSPAIDRGLPLGYPVDFAGTSIPQNEGPDLGAFEFPDAAPSVIHLADKGKALVAIIHAEHASATQRFAVKELQHYLKKITGADFALNKKTQYAISICQNNKLEEEEYTISLNQNSLVLAGGSDRAILYAVYEFLSRLGCRWFAPQLEFYWGQAEYVPLKVQLSYDASVAVQESPQFAFRKIDVEEGRSHTVENLKKIIEWMPKVRLNILMVPLNYQGAGKVKWDNWRDTLTPELKKRGLLIELGGHGYQNFLNTNMQGGALFKEHPEWFGKNKNCQPDQAQYLVFNTSNPGAVRYFTGQIVDYLLQHPEINIFDLWPPDGARWFDCSDFLGLGTAANRQAILVDHVHEAIKKSRPDLLLEIIAYGQVLQPPDKAGLDQHVLVDICPINQSFEKPIFDTTQPTNAAYANAIVAWRNNFDGPLGLYSYYRKYAWRSLPVIIPHYIQSELKWYSALPLQGISTYAEPADWFSYELNHYSLANLAWNPDLSLDSLLREYYFLRYGKAGDLAAKAYQILEEVEPSFSSIPFSPLKGKAQIEQALERLAQVSNRLNIALKQNYTEEVHLNLSRLSLMLQYAAFDLKALLSVAAGDAQKVEKEVKEMYLFLKNNSDKGVFLISGRDDVARYLRHYINRK